MNSVRGRFALLNTNEDIGQCFTQCEEVCVCVLNLFACIRVYKCVCVCVVGGNTPCVCVCVEKKVCVCSTVPEYLLK